MRLIKVLMLTALLIYLIWISLEEAVEPTEVLHLIGINLLSLIKSYGFKL